MGMYHRRQAGDGMIQLANRSVCQPALPRAIQHASRACSRRCPLLLNGLRCAALLLLIVACIAVLAFGSTPAFADEPASQQDIDEGNAVNVQQRPDSSFIYDTSIDDLAAADTYYDGQTVQVTGEAVGDNIRANPLGDKRWITLESEGGTGYVSVYMTEEQAKNIDTFGEYGAVGTTLQVRGTYHLACRDHQGLSDLHAEVVSVVYPGSTEPDKRDMWAFAPGAALTAIGLILAVTYYVLRERQR